MDALNRTLVSFDMPKVKIHCHSYRDNATRRRWFLIVLQSGPFLCQARSTTHRSALNECARALTQRIFEAHQASLGITTDNHN